MTRRTEFLKSQLVRFDRSGAVTLPLTVRAHAGASTTPNNPNPNLPGLDHAVPPDELLSAKPQRRGYRGRYPLCRPIVKTNSAAEKAALEQIETVNGKGGRLVMGLDNDLVRNRDEFMKEMWYDKRRKCWVYGVKKEVEEVIDWGVARPSKRAGGTSVSGSAAGSVSLAGSVGGASPAGDVAVSSGLLLAKGGGALGVVEESSAGSSPPGATDPSGGTDGAGAGASSATGEAPNAFMTQQDGEVLTHQQA